MTDWWVLTFCTRLMSVCCSARAMIPRRMCRRWSEIVYVVNSRLT